MLLNEACACHTHGEITSRVNYKTDETYGIERHF